MTGRQETGAEGWERHGPTDVRPRPQAREMLPVLLVVAALLGVAILFGTTRMRTAYEARQESETVRVQPVVDVHPAQ
jgi:hypothetical protein